MKYRRLGRTGLKVSVIGMGTWQFGGEWGKQFSQDEVDRMFARARELGINLIDTAECYGDHTSEAFIGNTIRRDRQKWVVATKFGHKFHGYMQRTEPRSPQDVLQQLEDSLRALQTDYVDLYQFHSWGDKDFYNTGVWDVLAAQKRAGRIRHIGNSISSSSANLGQAEACERAGVEAIQLVYNRLDRTPEQRVLALCREKDLGVLARVPLASGYLTGKYKPGATFPEDDVRHHQEQQKIDERLKEVQRIAREEVPPGQDMAQWALAWCLRHEAVSAVIPGCKSVRQVEDNAKATDLVPEEHPQAWRD